MRIKLSVLAASCALLAAMAMPALASAHGTHLVAKMKGSKVVGGDGAPGGKGTAKLHVLKGKQRICFRIKFSGIGSRDGLNVGVYRGQRGKNGNEQFELEATKRSPFSGCVDGIKKKLLKKMTQRPKRYHVNLKTDRYPTYGAIRGQLTSDD